MTINHEPLKPPPTDYFLDFCTPGTHMYNVLKHIVGLVTKAHHDLDTNLVMIAFQFPTQKLKDIVEHNEFKLRIKSS